MAKPIAKLVALITPKRRWKGPRVSRLLAMPASIAAPVIVTELATGLRPVGTSLAQAIGARSKWQA